MAIRSIRSAIFAVVMFASAMSFGQIGISISNGPPPLPVYEQPLCPGDGYLWTPGYWAYDYNYGDYYWVPGTWVRAPRVGLFWTPGYWAWGGGGYRFYEGYWGPQVGFYGGINYGYGYFGEGYQGGRWERGHFYYNRSVNNVNVTNIHNVYNTTIINKTTVINRVSYNGGNGGVNVRPTRQQEVFARERHVPPVAAQTQHVREARSDVQLRASQNRGKPPVAATQRPGAFRDRGSLSEKRGIQSPRRRETGATENRPAPNNRANEGHVNHPNDRPATAVSGPEPSNDRSRPTSYPRPPPNAGHARPEIGPQPKRPAVRENRKQGRRGAATAPTGAAREAERRKPRAVTRGTTNRQRHQQETQQMEQRPPSSNSSISSQSVSNQSIRSTEAAGRPSPE
jgi:hypothetical protein